ncbi:MAG TPA: 4-alpha-glucanotransferase [Methanospirillum sp.]|nr:4-alpha-glucanotransferase [Methanospirillum sp.]
MNTRGSGILLHITSLPSLFGIGDLGPAAYQFIQFLADAGQRYWQILPIHPTDQGYDNSPYHALSAFAGNPLLISPERMVSDGFLMSSDLEPIPPFSPEQVDYPAVVAYKDHLFAIAFERFRIGGFSSEFTGFCKRNAWWLEDYSLYMAMRKRLYPVLWGDWTEDLRLRGSDALRRARTEEDDEVLREQFLQYLFSIQWNALHEACRDQGVILIGDIPIYVDYDSADVWTHPKFFKLDEEQRPTVVAGVPPDYFSETGQVWNSPVYQWEEMEKTSYSWWIQRIEHLITLVDYVRIDHFRGLVGFWEIPRGSETAISGRWVPAPAYDLLRTLERRLPYLPIIAEDLGIITADVREVIRAFSIPGMKVLLFAFGHGMPDSPYIPHNIPKECIVYTGTHDNNPARGWFTVEATEEERRNLTAYLGREVLEEEISWVLIRMAMMSVGNTVITPMQDILNLGAESRMNRPGTENGNWRWRTVESQFTPELASRLSALSALYGRR